MHQPAVVPTSVPDRLLDADEVAAILSLSPEWVRARARTGDLPCVRLGRYVRFQRAAIQAYVEARAEGEVRRRGDSGHGRTRR